MGERQLRPEDMATTSTAVTVPPQVQEPAEPVAVITLRQRAPRKKVVWTEDTVDNENMNKKKSKCCCIFHKRRDFGESDSDDSDDECEHCAGHVEKRLKDGGTVTEDEQDGPRPQPTATLRIVAEESAQAPPPAAPAPADPPRHGEPSTSM